MEQPSLFPEQPSLFPSLFPNLELLQDLRLVVVDTEAIARGGRESDPNARPISEAAADQGWGPVNLSEKPVAKSAILKRNTRPFRGRIRGESEGEQTPPGREEDWQLTDEEILAAMGGLGAARRILESRRGN